MKNFMVLLYQCLSFQLLTYQCIVWALWTGSNHLFTCFLYRHSLVIGKRSIVNVCSALVPVITLLWKSQPAWSSLSGMTGPSWFSWSVTTEPRFQSGWCKLLLATSCCKLLLVTTHCYQEKCSTIKSDNTHSCCRLTYCFWFSPLVWAHLFLLWFFNDMFYPT